MSCILTAEQSNVLKRMDEKRKYAILKAQRDLAEADMIKKRADVDMYKAEVLMNNDIDRKRESFFKDNKDGDQNG